MEKDVKATSVLKDLKQLSFDSVHRMTVFRVVRDLKQTSKKGILEADQRVEDYIRHLNRHDQYATLLYSNGILVVPGSCKDDDSQMIQCETGYDILFSRAYHSVAERFWDALPRQVLKTGDKTIYMTFEAASSAVSAFQFSLPVICLDACRIKCPNMKAVLLAATFQTTEGHLLSMCYGTAPGESIESWCFFLMNLRQVLRKDCPQIDYRSIVFMSDRHNGIIKGVEQHFPESKHLFCVMHLLRNLYTSRMQIATFWEAVEATDEELFQKACRRLPSSKKLSQVMALAKHWSRYAVADDGCKRYGVRTNNWAESQNNALMHQRTGPILLVLLNCFKYTAFKIATYRNHALSFASKPQPWYTPFAETIYRSNLKLMKQCKITFSVGEQWHVQEHRKTFIVDTSDPSHMTCSCRRFWDEEIPCQHILSVLYSKNMVNQSINLISSIYSKTRFMLAFPDKLPFYPNEYESYFRDFTVKSPNIAQKRGRLQVLRFASVGEQYTGNIRTHRVSRAPHQPITEEHTAAEDLEGQPTAEVKKDDDAAEQLRMSLDRDLAYCVYDNEKLTSFVLSFIRKKDDLPQDDSDEESESSDDLLASSDDDNESAESESSHMLETTMECVSQATAVPHPDVIVVEDSVSLLNTAPVTTVKCESPCPKSDPEHDVILVEDSISQSCMESTGSKTIAKTKHDETPDKESDPDQPLFGTKDLPRSKMIYRGPGNFRRRNSPMPKRRRVSTEKTPTDRSIQYLVTHDARTYKQRKKIYRCVFSPQWENEFNEANPAPTEDNPAGVQLVSRIPLSCIKCEELVLMSEKNDWPTERPKPCISTDSVKTFLAWTHSFTAVGLEAQATLFSHGDDGVIKYLALLPQINCVSTVSSRESDITELNAVKNFHRGERGTPDDYCMRCWIHTHPRFNAFMSTTDILQLYYNACLNRYSFGIVLSPRRKGVKALVVALTDFGFRIVQNLVKRADTSKEDRLKILRENIYKYPGGIYYQIPFETVPDACTVVDLRRRVEVTSQLQDFIDSGDADTFWA